MLKPVRGAQGGFSVIEALITIAIVGILVVNALPSWSAWTELRRVRAAAEAMHNGIQLARSEALTRNARTRFELTADGGWRVRCASVGTNSGCPDTQVLHRRSEQEARGGWTLLVNGSAPTALHTLEFDAFGRPNTALAGWIERIEVASSLDTANPARAMRVDISPMGRTRLCLPHAAVGSVQRC